MRLHGSLSDEKQNLIFALNGTGKSFIARSLRLFDKVAFSEMDPEKVPNVLVSEESNGNGRFSLFEGDRCIGKIDLETERKIVHVSKTGYIFHVFSEDYVDENVRNRLDDLDGNITHEIIIGRKNAALDKKIRFLKRCDSELDMRRTVLFSSFHKELRSHRAMFGIRGTLGAFRLLSPDVFFREQPFFPNRDTEGIAVLLDQYRTIRSVPHELQKLDLPVEPTMTVDFVAIAKALSTMTSPSRVALSFKKRIQSDPDFFKAGLKMHRSDLGRCPFCRQRMGNIALEAIDAYTAYFNDAEAREIAEVQRLTDNLDSVTQTLDLWLAHYLRILGKYNEAKLYFPSLSHSNLRDPTSIILDLKIHVEELKSSLLRKLGSLHTAVPMPRTDWEVDWRFLRRTVAEAVQRISVLNRTIENSDKERRIIQNRSCEAFEVSFHQLNRREIDGIRELTDRTKALAAEVDELRRAHAETAPARDRVASTFGQLLHRFFQDRYSFDENLFKLRRNDKEMRKGGDRTLSDGEKAVLAFCYFIAQTHLRVTSLDDYQRMFLVFDDPVTSMSFDFIYSIIQTLKLLRIDANGDIKFSLNSKLHRPRMLILTHNYHFYNVVSTSNVVRGNGLFQLVPGTNEHKLECQKSLATPHHLQLRHVADVANERVEPDHTTANSIRSVVEGMWRFCHPDIENLTHFVRHLIDNHEVELKSVLFNCLSHYSDSEMLSCGDDIRLAAKETLEVVKILAPGQFKNINSNGKRNRQSHTKSRD